MKGSRQKFLIFTALVLGLAACSTEGETLSVAEMNSTGSEVGLAADGDPNVPALPSNPGAPPVVSNPTGPIANPSPSPSPTPNSNPTNPNTNPNPNPGGLGGSLEHVSLGEQVTLLPDAVAALPGSGLTLNRRFDRQVPLTMVGTISANQDVIPLASGGYMRFVKETNLIGPEENFLEIDFQVRYESRPREAIYGGGEIFPLRWAAFYLWACPPGSSCQVIRVDPFDGHIPATVDSGISCPQNSTCVRSFHAKISGSVLPGGGVESNLRYLISIEGTEEARERYNTGNSSYCTSDSHCSVEFPFCEGGTQTCSAIDPQDIFQVLTPSALRSLAGR